VLIATALGQDDAPPPDGPGNYRVLATIAAYLDWRMDMTAPLAEELAAFPLSFDGREVLDREALEAKLAGDLRKKVEYWERNIRGIDVLEVHVVSYDPTTFEATLEPYAKQLSVDRSRVLEHAKQLLNEGDLCVLLNTTLLRKQSARVETGWLWVLLTRTESGYKLKGFQLS